MERGLLIERNEDADVGHGDGTSWNTATAELYGIRSRVEV